MYNILQIEPVTFTFSSSKQSTRTQSADLEVPSGTDLVQACLQSFDVSYTDNKEYGFGQLQIDLTATSAQQVQCTVTLRDNNTDEREWSGTVTGVATSYSGSNS